MFTFTKSHFNVSCIRMIMSICVDWITLLNSHTTMGQFIQTDLRSIIRNTARKFLIKHFLINLFLKLKNIFFWNRKSHNLISSVIDSIDSIDNCFDSTIVNQIRIEIEDSAFYILDRNCRKQFLKKTFFFIKHDFDQY